MEIINERAERYKETLKIMSLSSFAYHIGVFLYSYLVGFTMVLFFWVLTWKSSLFTIFGHRYEFLLILFMQVVSSTNFTLFLGRFFNKARVGGEIITFI